MPKYADNFFTKVLLNKYVFSHEIKEKFCVRLLFWQGVAKNVSISRRNLNKVLECVWGVGMLEW